MDMTQINALSNEDKARYMRVSRVFGSDGWPDIVAHYENLAEQAFAAGANAKSWDDNRINVGLRMAYQELANLEDATEAYFVQLAEQAIDTTESFDEDDYE